MNHPTRTTALLCPAQLLAHPKSPAHTPAGLVGDTPVLWIGEPFTAAGRGFWAKLEGHNPGGIKDRPALHMVAPPGSAGTCCGGAGSSSPPAARSASAWHSPGAVYGHPVTVVTDPGMEPLMTGCSPPTAPRSTLSPPRTPPAAGSRPAVSGWTSCSRRTPMPGARTSTTTPTTSPPTHRSPSNSSHSSAGSTPWSCSCRHRRPLRRHRRACCAGSSPACASSASTRSARPSSASPPGPG